MWLAKLASYIANYTTELAAEITVASTLLANNCTQSTRVKKI